MERRPIARQLAVLQDEANARIAVAMVPLGDLETRLRVKPGAHAAAAAVARELNRQIVREAEKRGQAAPMQEDSAIVGRRDVGERVGEGEVDAL